MATTTPPRTINHKFAPAGAAVGGILAVIGSLMPWAQVHSLLGTISISGAEGDGLITAALGLFIAGFSLLNLTGQRRLSSRATVLVPAVLLFPLAAWNYTKVNTAVAEASDGLTTATVGSGMYVLLVGSACALAAAAVDVATHWRR